MLDLDGCVGVELKFVLIDMKSIVKQIIIQLPMARQAKEGWMDGWVGG